MDLKQLRGVMDSEEMKALRERNEQRAEQAKASLGRRWLCHPDNKVQKITRPNILDSYWGK